MVCHQVAFKNLHVFALRKLMKYLTEMLPDRTVYRLFAPLRNEHDMVLAIPPCMTQTLVLSYRSLTPYLVVEFRSVA